VNEPGQGANEPGGELSKIRGQISQGTNKPECKKTRMQKSQYANKPEVNQPGVKEPGAKKVKIS